MFIALFKAKNRFPFPEFSEIALNKIMFSIFLLKKNRKLIFFVADNKYEPIALRLQGEGLEEE